MSADFNAICGWGSEQTFMNPNCRHTQYGNTASMGNLELHVGNHLYLKRGGMMRAFVFDGYDYRYETLLESLGLPIENRRWEHFHLGTLVDYQRGKTAEENVINFRITEENATDLLIVVDDAGNSPLLTNWEYVPDAIVINRAANASFLVYSLARKNTKQLNVELFDDKFDMEPDDADLTGCHWSNELSPAEIIDYRLRICGFRE